MWSRWLILGLSLCSSCCFADEARMAHDILDEIIHSPINTDPSLSEVRADQAVIMGLKAAAVNLACYYQYAAKTEQLNLCRATFKRQLLGNSPGLADAAFAVGVLAASDQQQIHHEVALTDYPKLVQQLLAYSNNLASNGENLPPLP